MSLTLRWARIALKYKDKHDTYIWQPFRKSPTCAYVKISVSNREDPRNLRILLLFQNKNSRTSFQESYAEPQTFSDGASWSLALDGALAITFAYKHTLRETSGFLRQTSKQIMALVRLLNFALTTLSDTDLSRASPDFRKPRQSFKAKDAIFDPSERLLQESPDSYAAKPCAVARKCWEDASICT